MRSPLVRFGGAVPVWKPSRDAGAASFQAPLWCRWWPC